MDFFNEFTSNSMAGSGSQHWFAADPNTPFTGRLFYRITQGGRHPYSLLFQNIIDSTFADGSVSHCNRILPGWEILSAQVGRAKAGIIAPDFTDPGHASFLNSQVFDLQPLFFNGNREKTVAPGEFFSTDPVELTYEAGDYLCLELTVRGRELPYHEETHLPVYRLTENGWIYDKHIPFASMIGCARPIRQRIGFIGDSITQGIGTPPNAYLGWNAQLAAKLPRDLACWNLGLGYGRAADMASGGAWLYKALQNDILIVCYGVNDLYQYADAALLKQHLDTIVRYLTQAGKTVVLQTIPPFDYPDHLRPLWESVNDYIRTDLAQKVAGVFDVVTCLGQPQQPHMARYGGHPDAEGCTHWAAGLFDYLSGLPLNIF